MLSEQGVEHEFVSEEKGKATEKVFEYPFTLSDSLFSRPDVSVPVGLSAPHVPKIELVRAPETSQRKVSILS